MRLNGYLLMYNGIPIRNHDFRKNYIEPLVGERKSHRVIQGLEYMLFACGEDKRSRRRLLQKEDKDKEPRFLYEDYGIFILISCTFSDGICTATIIRYGVIVECSIELNDF